MATTYYWLLLSCISCLYSANSLVDNYQLKYWRKGNELLLFCNTPASFDDSVAFRINNSFIPIISQGPYISMQTFQGLTTTQPGELVQLSEHMQGIKFNLQPDIEGTIYCGNPDSNTWSRGRGPFVADPSKIEFNQRYLHQQIKTSNGSNETLMCPIEIGKLAQFYTVEWLGITEKSNRFKVEVKNFSLKSNDRILTLSTLTIMNIQDIDYKLYSCQVKVTNPINRNQWEINASIDLTKKWTWNWSPPADIDYSFSKITKIVLSIIFSLFVLFLCSLILCFVFESCSCCKNFRRSKRFSEETKPLLTVAEEGKNVGECYHEEEINVIKDGSDLQLEKDCIGIGAFGTVFKGTYKGIVCAAKMLTHHAQFYASERNYELEVQKLALQSLQKECEYLKELSHDNVVRYIDTINDCKSNLPILVMELMDCNLKIYLTRKSHESGLLPYSYQFHLFLNISQGLKFLHSKGYIHRDMCDDNVLLKEDCNLPTAKISDFGMSRIIPQDQMTSTLSALGHRQVYLPPEASEYPINYTHTLDVYALGVLGLQIALSEVRVKSCITLLDKLPEEHSLRKTIVACLQEDRLKRPSSSDVVNMITVL